MVGKRGLELLKKLEGWSRVVYLDQAGKRTVGCGHLIREGEVFDHPLNDAEIETLLDRDLAEAATHLQRWVGVSLNESQRDALLCFLFNVGSCGLVNADGSDTGVRTAVNERRWLDVPAALQKFCVYRDAAGALQRSRGLLRRRCLESGLFLEDRPI